jgi:hypothetical protein
VSPRSFDVAILGCGPAGLLAAHAVHSALPASRVRIFAPGARPSPVPGGVYVHRAIPGLTSEHPDGFVTFHKLGTAEGYAAKVYGDRNIPTSWRKFREGPAPAWHLAPMYQRLWSKWKDNILDVEITPDEIGSLTRTYDLVVCSAPGYVACERGHDFPSLPVWMEEDAPDGVKHNMMIYSGSPYEKWFRSSDIFGIRTTEYREQPPHLDPIELKHGIKVMATDCDCFPSVLRVGRWGEWRPGVLLHHAYEKTLGLMEMMP